MNSFKKITKSEFKKKLESGLSADPIHEAEEIIKSYLGRPQIKYGGNRAYYSPSFDYIQLPEIKSFDGMEEYYSTLFHELVHSTGHEDRLKRLSQHRNAAFGSEEYSKEELIAEFGSAFLMDRAGLGTPVIKNQVAYIQSWLGALKNDKNMALQAAGAAQKAANLILGIVNEVAEEN